jgi:hypothetical protein
MKKLIVGRQAVRDVLTLKWVWVDLLLLWFSETPALAVLELACFWAVCRIGQESTQALLTPD